MSVFARTARTTRTATTEENTMTRPDLLHTMAASGIADMTATYNTLVTLINAAPEEYKAEGQALATEIGVLTLAAQDDPAQVDWLNIVGSWRVLDAQMVDYQKRVTADLQARKSWARKVADKMFVAPIRRPARDLTPIAAPANPAGMMQALVTDLVEAHNLASIETQVEITHFVNFLNREIAFLAANPGGISVVEIANNWDVLNRQVNTLIARVAGEQAAAAKAEKRANSKVRAAGHRFNVARKRFVSAQYRWIRTATRAVVITAPRAIWHAVVFTFTAVTINIAAMLLVLSGSRARLA